MPNWKKFIVKENSGTDNITCLVFDGEIYNRSNCLSFFYRHPFNSFLPGDEVEIDVDKAIELMKSVDEWYKETNRGGYDLILKKRIDDENIIRPIRCRFQENMALVSRNSIELSMVRSEMDSLKTQNYNLQREKDNYQNLVRAGERELTTKNNQITTLSSQLTTAQNQLRDKEGQLTLSREEVKRITDLFNALQIESNDKNNKIISLREELESSQNIDLRYRERKLDELIRNLGLNKERIDNLRSAYERLKKASDRENYNQEGITIAQNEIDDIKREFFQTNVSIDDLHKVYKICEKVAELRVKQEKIRQQQQQQYQAHQEQPTNN